MTDALIGFTGFVGSNLARQHRFDALFNSANIEDIRDQQFNTLVFAGARAVKRWANQNAAEDWEGIEAALQPLGTVRARQAVLISTIDVLPNIAGVKEDFDCSSFENHAYGTNRLRLEVEFSKLFENVTIVRLAGLFGPGLAKNVIFDLLNNNILEKIEPLSRFQFYDLERLWSDIQIAIENDIRLVHLFPEPVSTAEIIDAFFSGIEVGSDPMPVASYDFQTQHARSYGENDGYIYTKPEVMERLGNFISDARRAAEI